MDARQELEKARASSCHGLPLPAPYSGCLKERHVVKQLQAELEELPNMALEVTSMNCVAVVMGNVVRAA